MSMKNSRQYDYEKQQQKTASAAINVAQLVKIIAYDPAKMTVDVQPISKRLDQGSYESQPPILSVPISCQRGGGFAMRVNYKPGDVGSVVFCDHDIDNAVAGGAEGEPNTERNHSSSDAVFMAASPREAAVFPACRTALQSAPTTAASTSPSRIPASSSSATLKSPAISP